MDSVHCTKCGRDLPPTQFYKQLTWGKQRDRGHCKDCHRKLVAGWLDVHREGWREWKRGYEKARREERYEWHRQYERKRTLKKYGVDQVWYDAKLAEQGGVCAICKQPESRKHHARDRQRFLLGIDHNHVSQTARGLLCSRCNRQLHALENSGWFASANQYLNSYNKEI